MKENLKIFKQYVADFVSSGISEIQLRSKAKSST